MAPQIELMYLVDGFNLLHAAILQGRDRRNWWGVERQRQVVALVDKFRVDKKAERLPHGVEIWVVFDRRSPEETESPADPRRELCEGTNRVKVHHAPNADDWIVQLCEQRQAKRTIVVSADRALLDRSGHRGAERLSPWVFSQMCGSSLSGRAREPGDVDP